MRRRTWTTITALATLAILALPLGRQGTVHAAKHLRVVMITSESGLGDHSFNDEMVKGFQLAKSTLGVDYSVIQPRSISEFQAAIQRAASGGYDIIIGSSFDMITPMQTVAIQRAASGGYDIIIGSSFDMITPMQTVAKQFPNQKFGLVDVGPGSLGPNIASTVTADWQGSALVGAIAARVSKTGTIGFVGGKDIPIIHRFWIGYYYGAKLSNPKIKVLQSFSGTFTDPAAGSEYANALYDQGSDINFGVAGRTTISVLESAKTHKKLAIGVDSDENCLAPGYVLTSMVKRVDVEAYDLIKAVAAGQNQGGTVITFGPAQGGVEAAMDSCNKGLISPAILAYAKDFSQKLLSKQIVVPNYFDLKKGQKTMGTPSIAVPSRT